MPRPTRSRIMEIDKDIQFVTQVGEDNIKLSDVRRSAYDPDELEDEQRERERCGR